MHSMQIRRGLLYRQKARCNREPLHGIFKRASDRSNPCRRGGTLGSVVSSLLSHGDHAPSASVETCYERILKTGYPARYPVDVKLLTHFN